MVTVNVTALSNFIAHMHTCTCNVTYSTRASLGISLYHNCCEDEIDVYDCPPGQTSSLLNQIANIVCTCTPKGAKVST